MDKNSLKKVIKPLIKECLKEVLMEEGLVKVIKEYNNSKESSQVLKSIPESTNFIKDLKKESVEKKSGNQNDFKKVALSSFGFDLFEGTRPAPEDGETVENEGVNISSLITENSNSWSQHLGIAQKKKA